MQAKMVNANDCVVVHLIGRLDVESAAPFRRALMEQLKDQKVVFDFRQLSFVGSSGIIPFLETMQDFAQQNAGRLRFCGVGSEFKRILSATTLNVIETYDHVTLAIESFRFHNRDFEFKPINPVIHENGMSPIFLENPALAETAVVAGLETGEGDGSDDGSN